VDNFTLQDENFDSYCNMNSKKLEKKGLSNLEIRNNLPKDTSSLSKKFDLSAYRSIEGKSLNSVN